MRRVALRTWIRFMGMRRFDRTKEKAGTFIRNRKGARRADRNAGITVASAPCVDSVWRKKQMKASQAQTPGLVAEIPYRIRRSDTKKTRDRREGMLPLPNGATAQTSTAVGKTSVVTRAWTETADSEARNALQVILSGSELLMDSFFGRLSAAQKRILEGVLGSARQLNGIIAALSNRDEIIGDAPLSNLHRQPNLPVVEPHGQARGTFHYVRGAKS